MNAGSRGLRVGGISRPGAVADIRGAMTWPRRLLQQVMVDDLLAKDVREPFDVKTRSSASDWACHFTVQSYQHGEA